MAPTGKSHASRIGLALRSDAGDNEQHSTRSRDRCALETAEDLHLLDARARHQVLQLEAREPAQAEATALARRVREREDVDAIHEFVSKLGAKVVHPPEEGAYAPGYYSVLFEDLDGIRLEANFVPGKGLLAND